MNESHIDEKAEVKWIKYRWEFLRRNVEYVEDFRRLQTTLNKIKSAAESSSLDSDIELSERSHYWNTIMVVDGIRICMTSPQRGILTPVEKDFCMKWNISEPVDPSKSYDQYFTIELKELKKALEEGRCGDLNKVRSEIDNVDTCSLYWKLRPLVDIPIIELDAYSIDTREIQEPVKTEYFYTRNLADAGKIKVEIDLNYSKTRLVRELETSLTRWQILYREACFASCAEKLLRDQRFASLDLFEKWSRIEQICENEFNRRKRRYKGRSRFDNYDEYVKVYDLRERGKSWATIQKTLNLNSVDTARDYYNAALKLVKESLPM